MALSIPTRPKTESADGESIADNTRVIKRSTSGVPASSNGHGPADTVSPVSSAEIMSDDEIREFILLAGKDGVGKSCAVVSMAAYVELVNPEARFFVLDTENKFRTALKSFGSDAPNNIVYYKTDNMNQVTWAANEILSRHKRGDWCAVESMSRVWERAQDLGYQAIAGMMKAEYMERRAEQVRNEGGKPAPVTPSPDQLWNITKGAHDGAFLDRLTASETLNVLLTTTISRPPKEGGFMRENIERKSLRIELGIDAGIEGAPRLPYYVETLAMLELKNGVVSCRILRDNPSRNDETRGEFTVEGKKTWASDFYTNCR
jgi:hypothetical protein